MTRTYFHSAWLCATALVALAPGAYGQTLSHAREDARLITAAQVLDELRQTPDQNVPDWLMQRAYGIAVIPEVIKGAFFFGGRYGNGALTVRDPSGHFSNPIFITLAGGSVGWQIGATSTDVVLVFVTPRSVENFARGKFTLGADASVAAGPVGRVGEAAAGVSAEIYSYSRSRGLFAGVALDGTVIAFDSHANQLFYGDEDVNTAKITSGKDTTQAESAQKFRDAVSLSVGESATPATAGAPAPAPAPSTAPPPPASTAPSSNDARSFPMDDNKPAGEAK
jgi:lipid-binding SYLF domain-containing protein